MTLRMSAKDAAALQRRGVPAPLKRVETADRPFAVPAVAGRYALGRLPKGTMNKTEYAYSVHLDRLKAAGEIHYWKFEPTNLRLADNTFYSPDFGVLNKDGYYEFHEVKGHWEKSAKIKIKVAAAEHPFKFIAVYKLPKKDGGGWKREDFSR